MALSNEDKRVIGDLILDAVAQQLEYLDDYARDHTEDSAYAKVQKMDKDEVFTFVSKKMQAIQSNIWPHSFDEIN
ncbi:hypothetical protein SEA_OTTERSTEDTS21_55 [Gordonia phage OtterstedtS21]|nr:hypothetical protein HWC68_gp57 [Gordonia phage Gibbin]QFG08194.1 hypothetical protein PBI_GRETELLYN_55 [Gordonia phage GretelLyn]UJQ86748.1 hypothetical protein SEA_JALEBI_55 [Gordonia phage Jalebi]UVT31035.1 hypothetical protein SEA_PARVUSTARDA_54 [Gordonia phage ParvusTarda]UVT31218.1 hypothetical protein SEA_OTTERSTEDTS21_55 [Gordonia phage OtterstedtS21]UVT31751.1 hypothetical protein SEA_PATOS_58 [Gordonia phage Patos]WNM65993.1 hypothetical protein SEA_BIRTHDAYBOY_57 [Gordonia phage